MYRANAGYRAAPRRDSRVAASTNVRFAVDRLHMERQLIGGSRGGMRGRGA